MYNIDRHTGDQWLLTTTETPTHLQDVYEEFVGYVNLTTLTRNQYDRAGWGGVGDWRGNESPTDPRHAHTHARTRAHTHTHTA